MTVPAVATSPAFVGTFNADPIHSSFAFAVRYQGLSLFRGSFAGASARLSDEDGELVLEGSARAEAISITNPPQFREHVLGEDFFDSAHYPEISFSSSNVALHEDGSVIVEGELTIRGVSKGVHAHGTYQRPAEDAMGHLRGAFELRALINREEFGITWNMPLPKGGFALDSEVVLTIDLQLVQE
jgi:polyisoprenoid-binding protein YceI